METAITIPDAELLDRYVRSRDEDAFRDLVCRYESLVISAAMRRTGNVEIARDVAQKVFVALARKAERLVKHGRIGGWLYQAASFEAARAMQAEQRRRHRQAAAAEDPVAQADLPNAHWAALEDALEAIGANERELIVQRYFNDYSYTEMAAELGMNDAAVRKRVSRAISKLGKELTRRGITTPTLAVLAGAAALQAQAPVQAGMTTHVLAAISEAPSTMSATALSISSSVMLKAATATVVLATIPLLWQWNENRAIRRDLNHLTDATGVSPKLTTTLTAEADASTSLRSEAAGLEEQLSDVRSKREAAENRLAALKFEAEQIRNEVVVSFGNVEEVATSMARLFQLGETIDSADNDNVTQAAAAELLTLMPTTTSAARALLRLDEDPQSAARFLAAIIGEIGDLDADARNSITEELLPHLEGMKEADLIYANRPDAGASDYQSWNDRYTAYSQASMHAIEHLAPRSAVDTEWWQSLSEGYGKFLHLMAEQGGPMIHDVEGFETRDTNGQSSQ